MMGLTNHFGKDSLMIPERSPHLIRKTLYPLEPDSKLSWELPDPSRGIVDLLDGDLGFDR
jgi:hypothetical protein